MPGSRASHTWQHHHSTSRSTARTGRWGGTWGAAPLVGISDIAAPPSVGISKSSSQVAVASVSRTCATWPASQHLQERYHRRDAVSDARHLGLAEGDAECLRDLRAMALDYIKRERGLEWRHLVDALRRRSGGGTQRVYAVVALDEESMQVAKPRRAGLMRPVRKKFARATGLHGFFSKKGRA